MADRQNNTTDATTKISPEVFEKNGYNGWMRDNIYSATPEHVRGLAAENFKPLLDAILKCREAGAPFEYVGIGLSMPKQSVSNPSPNEQKAIALCSLWKEAQDLYPELPRMSFKGVKTAPKKSFKKGSSPSYGDGSGKLDNEGRKILEALNSSEQGNKTPEDNPFSVLSGLKG